MTPVATRATKWSGQCILNGPSANKAHINGVGLYAKLFSPFVDVLGSSVKVQKGALATIADLRLGRGPAAILRAVVAIVVNAVNRIALIRSRPHILVESRKVALPSFADLNPSAAVLRIPVIIGVIAPPLDVAPVIVFRGETQPVSGSILSGLFAVHNEIVTDLGVA